MYSRREKDMGPFGVDRRKNLSTCRTRRPIHRLLAAACLSLGAILAAADASATVVPRMTLEQLVDASEAVVHGSVTRKWSTWDSGRRHIWTHYEIRVSERLKGEAASSLIVSEPGGEADGIAMQVAGTPEYQVGEEVVLFAARMATGVLRTCGWGQGKFRVVRASERGRATIVPGAQRVEIVERSASEARAEDKQTPLTEVNGLALDDFKGRVRGMIRSRSAPSQAR
jgi:hypothetical protein